MTLNTIHIVDAIFLILTAVTVIVSLYFYVMVTGKNPFRSVRELKEIDGFAFHHIILLVVVVVSILRFILLNVLSFPFDPRYVTVVYNWYARIFVTA